MSKIAVLMVLAGMLIPAACRSQRARLIPEVTSDMDQEEIPNLALSKQPAYFFMRGDKIGLAQPDGRVFIFSADPWRMVTAESLPFPMLAGSEAVDGLALLDRSAEGRVLLYDLAGQKVVGEWPARENGRPLSYNREFRVYRLDDTLIIEKIAGGQKLLRLPWKEYGLYGIHFSRGLIYGNSEKTLVCFRTATGTMAEYRLPQAAVGDGLLRAGHFYYGTSGRDLISFSLGGKNVIWKRRLPDQLLQAPFIYGRSVVAVSRGDTLLFLNGRGSVKWWCGLPSYIRFGPLFMKEHLAFVLQDSQVYLIQPDRRSGAGHPLTGRPDGPPFYNAGYLYMASEDPSTGKTMARFGNRYGVSVTCSPEKPRLGKSVLFECQTHNLVAPRLSLRLEDAQGQIVLEKEITPYLPFSLAWIPNRGGAYRLFVRAEAKNGIRETTFSFQVFDWLSGMMLIMRLAIGLR